MKIFSKKQIYNADKFTLKDQNIESIELMERASLALFNWLHSRLEGKPLKINLFCGIGNNGGDGLALARHLWEHGYAFKVYIVNYSENRSEDFLSNLKKLKERKIWPEYMNEATALPEIGAEEIIIDAIFGIGLNRNPDVWVARIIKYINDNTAYTLSVDVPSGLFLDRKFEDVESVVKAHTVLSFQFPKLIFFLPDTSKFCGTWEILDIGLSTKFITDTEVDFTLIDKADLIEKYRFRDKFSHKGDFGHSLLIGGSYGKIGAMVLAAKACIGSGSGLVTAYVPQCGYLPLQTAVPEVMVITDKGENDLQNIDFKLVPSVIGIGMGMGTSDKTGEALTQLIKNSNSPMVIDADGLNLIAKNMSLLEQIPSKTVLTPHPGELKRLIGDWEDDFDKIEKTKRLSKSSDCIIVIKGANTIIIYREKSYINSTGNPGMATAGSGDVLSGIITSLIAQQYEPLFASILGVYLHGRAGDIAASHLGMEALTASSIIASLGTAFLDLFSKPNNQDKTT